MQKTKLTLTERVFSVLERGPATVQEIMDRTGMTKKQAEGVCFRYRIDGTLQRGPGGTQDGKWSIVDSTKSPTGTPSTNGMGLGDLFEVAGTLTDGTWTIRSLDAPHTIYALKEVQ